MKPNPYQQLPQWLLCPAAHEEAERTGLIYRCEGRRNHVCSGPRTPYLWKATGDSGAEFLSDKPHCGSCLSDQENGDGGAFGWPDTACCCIHSQVGK